MKLIGTMHIPT